MHTPSQILASRIIEKLVQEGLLTEEIAEKIQPNLADGTLREGDWRLQIELSADSKNAKKEDKQ